MNVIRGGLLAGVLAVLIGASLPANASGETAVSAPVAAPTAVVPMDDGVIPDDGWFNITCTPWASIDLQGAPTARGETHCVVPANSTIGVTTILYVDGYNLGSAYNECTLNDIAPICPGIPVTRDVTGSTFCARTLVSYQLPDGWHQVATSSGTGCPL
ncbi:MAG: hypothetical protein ABWY03_00700 [Microbacterium sp.]